MADVITPDQDVVHILSRFDRDQLPEKTLRQRLSQPPKRFYVTTLLVMLWGVLLMAVSPMLAVSLENPLAWFHHEHQPLFYAFQVPMALLVGGILGPRFGTMALLLYVVLGFLGFPLFAGGGGQEYLTQPAVGYLLGFLAVPWAAQRMLTKAFRGTAWFRGRSLWMGLGALNGVLLVHLMGVLGLGMLAMLGTLTWEQAGAWITQLSWPVLLYDLAFGWVAVAMVRLFRLMLWFCLY